VDELEIEAVYEQGSLKLPRELPLCEGQKVTITMRISGEAAVRRPSVGGDPQELQRFLEDPDEGMWAGHDL
jgi:predicted DNA-binding antitoxin AbrB/MazE fold protein